MLRSTLTTLPILRTAALRSSPSYALAIRSKSAVEGVKDAARSVQEGVMDVVGSQESATSSLKTTGVLPPNFGTKKDNFQRTVENDGENVAKDEGVRDRVPKGSEEQGSAEAAKTTPGRQA